MVELRPRRTRTAAAVAESATIEETPKPKTPKASKRKATEDVSPSAMKKQKAVRTPAKPKDTKEPAPEKVEEPMPKAKKGKTPVKAKAKTKAGEEEVPQEPEQTPVSKPKKAKTPSKAKAAVEEAPQEPAEKTPVSKSKKEKTHSKAGVVENTPSKQPEQSTPKTNKEKTPAKATQTPKATPKESTKETPVTKQTKKPKSAKKEKSEPEPVLKPEPPAVEMVVEEAAAPQDEEIASVEEEADEQTQALVQTIDAQDDDEPESGIVLFEQGQDVGKIPEVSKERKRAKKALAASKEKEETGVIYIGRLPHGFYEHEMKSYFSQFGPIRNLRVSRNKKTGKAKHFAFVEFEDASTAEIVAKTMDNYMLFGHLLKCSVIPKGQVHDDLFKGANKRFKPVPWNKMEGKVMERPMLESKWERKIAKERKRRADRAKQLEALGYEYTAPELKTTEAAKAIAAAPETVEEELSKVIEEAKTEAIEAIETAPATAQEAEITPTASADEEKDQVSTPKPAKRGRGRAAKTPQKAALVSETPRSTRRRKA